MNDNELARKCFVSLIKDKAIIFGKRVPAYYVLNDGNYIDRIYANNDIQAVELFTEKYL